MTSGNDTTELRLDKDDAVNKKLKYPKRIFLIIGNEFCERFSYYGMRTVLILYFRNFLELGDDNSTSLYHAFAMLSYFTPLLGGIISDSYWGKYKTIVVLSLVYIAGHALKTVAAIPFIPSRGVHIAFSVLGLMMIALGTGGIKPCVSSLGGDQFHPSQVIYRNQFFSMFYFTINCGALLAKIIMPMIRADLRCYPGYTGPTFEECYSVAFGIPGVLMIIATVTIVAGSPFYTKLKPSGSVFMRFCKCIVSACRNRWNTKPSERNKDHWIDYADSPPRMKRDTKYVLAVLMIFSPLPIFWTLFDQQGSRWTLQALQMDRQWGGYLVKPEQMDTVNPLLILTLIPLFEVTLYPLLRRNGISFTPIKRMTAGLILAGVAFLVTAIVQFQIDKNLTPQPKANEFAVRIVNTAPCELSLTSARPEFDGITLPELQTSNTAAKFIDATKQSSFEVSYTSQCMFVAKGIQINPVPGKIMDVVITQNYSQIKHFPATKQHEGEYTELSLINTGNEDLTVIFHNTNMTFSVPANKVTSGVRLPLGNQPYAVYNDNTLVSLSNEEIRLQIGGLYSLYLVHDGEKYNDLQEEYVNHFTVNVAWMLPQYLILTVGEVFLSITGLEFAYSQNQRDSSFQIRSTLLNLSARVVSYGIRNYVAFRLLSSNFLWSSKRDDGCCVSIRTPQAPPSMRSVVTSFWLLTVSLGNVIVVIVAQMKTIERRAHEFILFAMLIFVASGIFMVLGKRFTPVDEKEFENDNEDDIGTEKLIGETTTRV